MVWCLAALSGGHINPAITFAFLVARKIGILRGVFYIVFQCLGAMAGAGLLSACTSQTIRDGSFGCNGIAAEISVGQAVLIESLITFILTFTVFATSDEHRKERHGGMGPLEIGIAVLISHLAVVSGSV